MLAAKPVSTGTSFVTNLNLPNTDSQAAVALLTTSCHAGAVAKAAASTPKAATQAIGGPTAAAERRCGAERRFQPARSELPRSR